MERVGGTVNVSLRYGRSFENEASCSAMEVAVRKSDTEVDFDDVFGGPPTRTRYSFGGGRIKSSEESTSSPVFGEPYSSPRRRTSDDFYDDIFRRSDDSVRSPRWSSPTTLSPKIDPFSPTDFSLPAKMSKTVDIPVFGSNSTPNTSLSRFSSPTSQGRDIFRNNQGQTPGQTLLSRESTGVTPSTARVGSPSSEFHFSIHKWANVGVPLLMSLRGAKYPTLKGSSKVSALSMDIMQDSGFPNDDLLLQKQDVKPISETQKTQVIEKEILNVKQQVKQPEVIPPSSLLHDEIERQGYEEAGKEAEKKEKTEPNSDFGKKKVDAKKTNSGKKTEVNKSVIGSPKSSPKNRVKGMVKDFFKMSNQETLPKTKTNAVSGSLSSRWKTTAKSRTQEEVNVIISNLECEVPVENAKMQKDASKNIKLDSEVVVENVKLAPDASTKMKFDNKLPAENVKMVPDASKKTKVESKLPEKVKMAPDVSSTNVNKMADDSPKVKEEIGKSNKPKLARDRTIKKLEDIYFQNDAKPASVSSGSKVTIENIDDPSLDNFQVEELSPDDEKLSKTQEESEAFKALDSKIHQWSSGRKGNIRSLLSTLQLVLWADSGWKPVALVDIIEANAVKKSYNRAMLCLHPDKLQQKGADSQKKYMAEKVFDILQEAWDHFNSLGTLL